MQVQFCDPMDCNPTGPSVHGIFHARTLEWVAISFSRGLLTNACRRSCSLLELGTVSCFLEHRSNLWASRFFAGLEALNFLEAWLSVTRFSFCLLAQSEDSLSPADGLKTLKNPSMSVSGSFSVTTTEWYWLWSWLWSNDKNTGRWFSKCGFCSRSLVYILFLLLDV